MAPSSPTGPCRPGLAASVPVRSPPGPAAPGRERPHPRGLQRQTAGRATQAVRSSTPPGKPRPLAEGRRHAHSPAPPPQPPRVPPTPTPNHHTHTHTARDPPTNYNPKEGSHHPTNTNPRTNTRGKSVVRDRTFTGLSVEFRAGRERERLWLVPLGERSAVARSTFPMSSGLPSQSMIPRPTARAQPEARWAPTPSCLCGSRRLARRPARRRRCLRAPQAPRSRRRWRR